MRYNITPREKLIQQTIPTFQQKQYQNNMAWIKLFRLSFRYKYIDHLSTEITYRTI